MVAVLSTAQKHKEKVAMPPFDFFKKSPKKEPAKPFTKNLVTPSKMDDAFLSPEMQKKRHDAAMEFIKVFQEKIPLVNGKPHAGTVLSTAARLAGTSLYRSINKKVFTPGVVVLSEEVNQAYPQLLNLFAFYCKQNGMDVMAKPLVTKFPEQDKPRMELAQVQTEYQDQYDEIMKKHGLDYLNAARAGMMVCSIVFQHHCTVVKDIDPYIATGIVAMGVIEGAKTAPPPLGTKSTSAMQKQDDGKQNKNRLLLGERDDVIKESHENGGTFIDINPGVLQILKQGNIDPYLIHEKGLLQHIEAKIPRIDFINMDVDKLFAEWKQKSYDQAPIHIRLMMWLKNNSAVHNYEQDGNSWFLKK
jgi:hypothetical protein